MALPGLTKLHMPQRTAIKDDAGQSLRSQPIATGSGTRSAITSSVSSSTNGNAKLNQSTTAGFFGVSLYGVSADRTNRLYGNAKAGYSAGISNLRHSLLYGSRGMRYNTSDFWRNPNLQNAKVDNSYMDSYMKMMEVQAFTKSIGDLAAGGVALATAFSSDKTDKTETPKETKTTVTENKGGISSQLTSATTSKELTSALSNLDKSIETLNNSISENNESIKEEQGIQEQLNTEIESLNSDISNCESNLRNLEVLLNSGKMDQTQYDTQKTILNNKLTELRKQKAEKETQLKNSQECETKLTEETNDFKQQVAQKEKEQKTYNQKLEKMKSNEQSQLSKLDSALSKLKADYNQETDSSKKAKLSKDYTSKATEFNSILNGAIEQGSYTAKGLSIDLA